MEPGSNAPPFTLPDQDGRPVTLSELAGRWVVLFFYPKDDTPGCTIEANEFTAAKAAFSGLDAIVYGCSADPAASHQKFIAKYGLGVGLLTDADRSVMRAYGAWGKKMMYGNEVEGVIRSTVLIAPDGRVAHHWPQVKAQGHAEAVRSRLAELQGVAVAAPVAVAAEPEVVLASVPPVGACAGSPRAVEPVTKASAPKSPRPRKAVKAAGKTKADAKAKAKPARKAAPKRAAGTSATRKTAAKSATKAPAKVGRGKGKSAATARGKAKAKRR